MAKKRPQSPRATQRARRLRRNSTFLERRLWSHLRAGRLAGLKFRRQYPLEPFIVDFYCHEAHLAVELDGMSHNGRAAQDNRRTQYLMAQ